ncbi:hypothetical protein GR11A_00040 [Vibrio phage vB_VcorM_GR11A]|nr:hypothetical protein GR11A_00040 [Vibrio phage vB_VcorM_GR11A]
MNFWVILTKLGLTLENGFINKFEECWICKTSHSLEDHHIIPRCSGGENGPQVELCAVCHSAIHKAAVSSTAVKESNLDQMATLEDKYNERWVSETMQLKGFTLASVIRSAAEAVKGDDNKTAKYATTWSGEDKRIINDLKTVLGVKSQDKVVRLALRSLHKKYYR